MYAARLARLVNDPSYSKRREAIDAWNADGAGDFGWPVRRRPVMQTIDGDACGFEKLRDHPIYKHRARAEVDWILSGITL